MKSTLMCILLCPIPYPFSKTIHVFVALCDHINQGIVSVPESLGNGQNPTTNLYWGALYGVKLILRSELDFFNIHDKRKSRILERVYSSTKF